MKVMSTEKHTRSAQATNAAHVAGDRDLQFNTDGYLRHGGDPFVTDPTTDIDQRFYVITYGESVNSPSRIVGRLPDGPIDPAFGNLAIPVLDDTLRALIDVQGMIFNNNGTITCVGITDVNTPTGRFYYPAAIRITTSGAMDESFGNKGRKIYPVDLSGVSGAGESDAPDLKALSHGFASVRRTVQESGDILFFCSLSKFNPTVGSYHLVKIAENGDPVATFGTNGVLTIPAGNPDRGLTWLDYGVDSNGSITLAGLGLGSNASEGVVTRYTSDGELDSGFGDGGEKVIKIEGANVYVKKASVSKDGEVILLLSVRDRLSAGSVEFAVMKLDSSGREDMSFNNGSALVLNEMGGQNDSFVSMDVDAKNRIIVAGQDAASKQTARLTRITSGGTPDDTFGNNGSRTYDDLYAFHYMAIQNGTDILANSLDPDFTVPNELLLFRFFGEAG
jgi:uncharacterized delta-60 repeat protein